MCKRMTLVISFIAVLFLVGNVSAATVTWDNGGTGNLWSVPENWDNDTVPNSEDTVQIGIPDANCIIDSSVTAECLTLYVGYVGSDGYLEMTGGSLKMNSSINIGTSSNSNGVMVMSGGLANMGTDSGSTSGRLNLGTSGTGVLIMRGGEMNIYDKTSIGRNSGGNGSLYMEGGTITFRGNSADLELGTTGTGTIYMTGGTLDIEDNIKFGESGGTGTIYLDGGTVYAANLRPVEQCTGVGLIDITEGVLIFNTDRRPEVEDFIEAGWLVAYHGLGQLDVLYTDEGQTIVRGSSLPPELAGSPNPRNFSAVERPVTLSWSAGIYADSHDVYFGTDPNAVSDANNVPGLWPEFKGNQDTLSFNPGNLTLGQIYYWRVDEVNESYPNSPWEGVVWSFTLVDYIVLDNFESYNEIPTEEPGSNLIYNTWLDGYANPSVNGSTIGYISGNSLETTQVHDGKQSAPLAYNNTVAEYSEATVNLGDLGIGPDLKPDEIKSLSLWMYGGEGNSAEQMYVKLNGSKLNIGVPEDVRESGWKEKAFDIELFGVDLSNVSEFAIGFDRDTAIGGFGTMLLDDIRLSQIAVLLEATLSFSSTAPTPRSSDIYNFVGSNNIDDNIGTYRVNTYVSFQYGAQGQTFLTGSNANGYTISGVWVQHVYYTESDTDTLYMMPIDSDIEIRVTDPNAAGTEGFVLSKETYTITGDETLILPSTYTTEPRGTGRWIHVKLAKPVALAANTEYGFDLLSPITAGYPTDVFFEMAGIDDSAPGGNPYVNGSAYTSGAAGRSNNDMTIATGDHVFLVELNTK